MPQLSWPTDTVTLQSAKAVLGLMAEQGSGVIINIASINGLVGLTGADAYTATKGHWSR